MRHALDLFRFDGRVTRKQYVAAGAALFAIKYPGDHIISHAFHHAWNPLMYLSPRVSPLLRFADDERYWVTLLLWALPFMWAGVSLTARRLRDAGVNPFWAGLFFLPFLHLVAFTVLALMPSLTATATVAPAPGTGGPFREGAPPPVSEPPRLLTRMIPRRSGLAYLFGLGSSIGAALVAYIVTVQVSSAFGTMLFVALPFGMGFWTAFSVTYHEPARSRRSAIGYGCLTVIVSLLVLLTTAWEGMACIVMATPILLVCSTLGAWLGWSTARQRPLAQTFAPLMLLLIPGLVGADLVRTHDPAPLAVTSRIVVHAPRDRVWRNVVAFPPIDSPPAPIFAIVAMPLEARIDGHDPGATRRCIFTNGEFVEPIEVWDAPRELRFGVERAPMNIEEYAQISGGRFLLTDNGDGTTTLEGTTWYRLKVFPTFYWSAWAQTLLHAIHMRVLEHIARLAEHPEAPVATTAAAEPAWMATANETCACTRHAGAAADVGAKSK